MALPAALRAAMGSAFTVSAWVRPAAGSSGVVLAAAGSVGVTVGDDNQLKVGRCKLNPNLKAPGYSA